MDDMIENPMVLDECWPEYNDSKKYEDEAYWEKIDREIDEAMGK